MTIYTTEIQNIIRGYNEQLYDNKLYNLEELDKFAKTESWKIQNLNIPIMT